MASRFQNTMKNFLWGNVGQLISLIIKFISRTIFIRFLSNNFLGVSGLFTNVLGVLSFTELGIGTAMNFSLYKPVADKDEEKIKSLMLFYKQAYRVISAIVAIAGIAVIPFLKYLIKDPGDVGNIYFYYLIYLFDTATSYLVTYKYSLASAEQKNYIITNVNTAVSVIQTATQICAMLVLYNLGAPQKTIFIAYLLSSSIIGLLQKIFNTIYLNKKYPYLNDNPKKLTKEEKAPITKNVKALIVHKLGDVCVHQTDNILISVFINVATVGKISNYNYIIITVSAFLVIIFNSAIGSLGNLIASESSERQYEIFNVYRFIGFWIYGFSAIAFYTLFNKFITIWAGTDWTVDSLTVLLICLERYFVGHRIVVNNFKSAAGIFDQDKWVAFGQAGVNLVVSIIMVKLIGLPGIYVGTVLQGLVSTFVKPVILYRTVFDKKAVLYYLDSLKYLVPVVLSASICILLRNFILNGTGIGTFICLMIITAIIPNLIFVIAFRKNESFVYLKNKIFGRFRRQTNG